MRKSFRRNRRQLFGWLFISPWILGFMVFTAYPLFETMRYSLSTVRFLLDGIEMDNVGFTNYTNVLLKDPDFKLALPGYLTELLFFVPMVLVFSILLALLLNSPIRMRRLFRSLFFLPVVIMSGPVVGNLRQMGATTLKGLRSFFIYRFIAEYFPGVAAAPVLYIFDNAVLILWFCGVQILIFLSGLQKVDKNIYEAARVDGASGWQQLWKITMPMLKPFIFLNGVYTVVDVSMSSLNPVITVIKEGLFNIRKGFGFSAAASWIYFLIIVMAVIVVYLLFGREERTVAGKKTGTALQRKYVRRSRY
ncbi:sugar ABC transporter permease [Pseudoclostridium thermosuccinogenes]|uniref:carbohydrate ABC transporter permease n=1 Tax=Clostridium thermosuccinogenes TaxID=84032 RepID=UPI002FD8A624